MMRGFIIALLVATVWPYRDIPEVVTKVATSTANWLKLETSARAIGMGALMLLLVVV